MTHDSNKLSPSLIARLTMANAQVCFYTNTPLHVVAFARNYLAHAARGV
jgi:hypothetical protein